MQISGVICRLAYASAWYTYSVRAQNWFFFAGRDGWGGKMMNWSEGLLPCGVLSILGPDNAAFPVYIRWEVYNISILNRSPLFDAF